MPLKLTWFDLAFSCTKGYPSQVKRHSLPFQVEAAPKYLVVPLTFTHNCTYVHTHSVLCSASSSPACRTALEGKIDEPTGLDVPVLVVVVEGGLTVIDDVLLSLRRGSSVLVLKGTGRAADILAAFAR